MITSKKVAISSCSAQERKLIVFRRQARIEVDLSLKSVSLHNLGCLCAFPGLNCVNFVDQLRQDF